MVLMPKKPQESMKMKRLIAGAIGVTAIGRHSLKSDSSSGLSTKGELKASYAGRNLPKGFDIAVRTGRLPRHQATANKMFYTYPGKRLGGVKIAYELGLGYIKNEPVVDRLIAGSGDAKVLESWIAGRIPSEVMEKPLAVGIQILRGAVPQTYRHISKGARPFALNITSCWSEAAILKALGIDYKSIKPKRSRSKNPPKQGEPLKETEAMLFFHMPDGRTILAFRGRRFDVTKKLQEILG